MNFLNFIQSHHLQNYIFFAIFFGMFVEATLTVFAGVFLMAAKVIGVAPGIAVLLLGIFSEQLVFYWLGIRLSMYKWPVKWINKIAAPFDRQLLLRPFRTLLASKFAYGLHHGILIRSGMLKLPFNKYVENAVYISVIWLSVVGSLGLAFVASYQQFKKIIRFAELIPLVLVVIFLLIEWMLRRRLAKAI